MVKEAAATSELITQPDKEAAPEATATAGTSRTTDEPRVDRGANTDATRSRCVDEVDFGQALFDADNTFNRANHYLLLWNICYRWNKTSRFASNQYHH